MEEDTTVDGQGRLVLPSEVRRKLGLSKGGKVAVRLDGSRAFIEPKREGVEELVKEWIRQAMMAKNRAVLEGEVGGKWLGEEYVKRKLGIS